MIFIKCLQAFSRMFVDFVCSVVSVLVMICMSLYGIRRAFSVAGFRVCFRI